MTAKKINLLLVRAYAYARERVIIDIFTNSFLDSSVPSLLPSFSTLLLFFSVPPIVCEKQHVVFNKTTRRFQQNNTSFSAKQHVTFNKTTRRFQQNNTSLSIKQHVINEIPNIYCIGQHSRKRTSNETILLVPTTMVQDVPSIKAQEVVNSTITTTEHARMFPNVDSDSRFSDIAV